MATLGSGSKPGGGWRAYGGSSQPNQLAELLTMPVRGRLLELGAWVGGWSDTPRVRLSVWDTAGVLLGQSAQITVANEGGGGPAGSNVALYTELLEVPVELAAGVSFYVGPSRHVDDSWQVSLGATGSGPHYLGRSGSAGWPTPNKLGNVGGITEEERRIGAYVANYEAIPGAHIYRSGAWAEAEAVNVQRAGVAVEAEAVRIFRSGAWIDAQ